MREVTRKVSSFLRGITSGFGLTCGADMITAGDKQVFAVEAEITGSSRGWIFGRFRFVIRGKACGNWNDETDLRGCYSWLKDFSDTDRQRFEPGLMELSADEIFEKLVNPVLTEAAGEPMPEVYVNTFSRFHISHLGMSAFDRIVMVLIEATDLQRCLWHVTGESTIHDELLPPHEMQNVAEAFCKVLERETTQLGLSL